MLNIAITLQPALAETLQQAAHRHGINRCQVIREALQLWLQLDGVMTEGKRFLVAGDGEEKEILLVGLTPAIRPGRQEKRT